MGALEFAICPHARSPSFAESFGIANRGMAWGWITDQIKQTSMDTNWTQAPNLSKIADIFARTMVFMGKCRVPLYLSESKAEDWFLIWRMLNDRRMERNGQAFTGAEGERKAFRPSTASLRRIAERNQAKARLRYLRARRLDSKEDGGVVPGEDSFQDEPLADESLPPENSDLLFTLSPDLSLPLGSSDRRLTFSSLKRPGGTLESESIKERKKEEGSVRDGAQVDVHVTAQQTPLADYGIIQIDEDTRRLALVPEDIQNTIEMPTAGWPTYQELYGRPPCLRTVPNCGVRGGGSDNHPQPQCWERYRLHIPGPGRNGKSGPESMAHDGCQW